MKFTKIRDVKTPSRANAGDAGVDFYVPSYTTELAEKISKVGAVYIDNQNIKIPPQSSVCIPSGIKVIVPFGKALIAKNKSGIASKKGLVVGACVIDYFYAGEVHIDIHNIGDSVQVIDFGTKLVQFVLQDVDLSEYEEISNDEYINIMEHPENTRGAGGFGSTGIQ